jgi:hypothetical protein
MPFACDHVILRFWDDLISDLQSKNLLESGERAGYMKDIVDCRIRQTPRNVTCTATDDPGELHVKWTFFEQKRYSQDSIVTILHSSDCEDSAIIHRDGDQGIYQETHLHIYQPSTHLTYRRKDMRMSTSYLKVGVWMYDRNQILRM